MTPPKSNLEIANNSIKRFSVGAVAGLLISAIQWDSYIYFMGEPISLGRGIIFCLGMSIICGLIIIKWGYKSLDNLLQILGQ